jgi:hypothetical protein
MQDTVRIEEKIENGASNANFVFWCQNRLNGLITAE